MPSSKFHIPASQNIVTVEIDKERVIESYNVNNLRDNKGIKYSEVLKDVTEPYQQKNARFRISEATRSSLSIEQEEEQRIQKEIQIRLEKKLQEVKETSKAEAYIEGFAVGKKEAWEEVLSQAKPLVAAFDKLVNQLETCKSEIFKTNEEFLIRMSYQLAKAVILRELKEDRDYVKRLMTHLLEMIGTRENIKIFVNHSVYSSAETLKQGLAQNLGELKNITIEVDPTVDEDQGCRVETDFGDIDARIEVQLQRIAQTLGVPSK